MEPKYYRGKNDTWFAVFSGITLQVHGAGQFKGALAMPTKTAFDGKENVSECTEHEFYQHYMAAREYSDYHKLFASELHSRT